jgi:hypothetical protein
MGGKNYESTSKRKEDVPKVQDYKTQGTRYRHLRKSEA